MSFLLNTNSIQKATGAAPAGSLTECLRSLAPTDNPVFSGTGISIDSSGVESVLNFMHSGVAHAQIDSLNSGDLIFYNGASTLSERMRITSSGLLRIPGYVHSYPGFRAYVDSTLTGSAYTTFGQDSVGGFVETSANLPLRLYTGGVERLRISYDGNVGIGTPNPVNKFVVSNGINNIEFIPSSVSTILSYSRTQGTYMPLVLDAEQVLIRSMGVDKFRVHPDGVAAFSGPFGSTSEAAQPTYNPTGSFILLGGMPDYSWVQSYNKPLILNPLGNRVGIGLTPYATFHSMGSTIIGVGQNGFDTSSIGWSQCRIMLEDSTGRLYFEAKTASGILKIGYLQLT